MLTSIRRRSPRRLKSATQRKTSERTHIYNTSVRLHRWNSDARIVATLCLRTLFCHSLSVSVLQAAVPSQHIGHNRIRTRALLSSFTKLSSWVLSSTYITRGCSISTCDVTGRTSSCFLFLDRCSPGRSLAKEFDRRCGKGTADCPSRCRSGSCFNFGGAEIARNGETSLGKSPVPSTVPSSISTRDGSHA